jgi:hypothetical protein
MKPKLPRDPRFKFEADISHDIVIPDIHYDGKISNLSSDGIYFESNERIEPGDEISVTVKKLDGTETTFDVEVTRRERIEDREFRFGYGARSTELNKKLVKILDKVPTPTPKKGKDLRGYCRHIYNKLLRFRHGNKLYNAWVRDISRGGAFIQTRLKFPVGKKVVLTMPSKGLNSGIRLKGWIVRCSEGGFAIKFDRRAVFVERRFDVDRRTGRNRRKK